MQYSQPRSQCLLRFQNGGVGVENGQRCQFKIFQESWSVFDVVCDEMAFLKVISSYQQPCLFYGHLKPLFKRKEDISRQNTPGVLDYFGSFDQGFLRPPFLTRSRALRTRFFNQPRNNAKRTNANISNFGNVYFVVKHTAHPSVPKTVFLLQRHIEQLIPKLPVNVFDVAFGLKNGLLCLLQITKSNFYFQVKKKKLSYLYLYIMNLSTTNSWAYYVCEYNETLFIFFYCLHSKSSQNSRIKLFLSDTGTERQTVLFSVAFTYRFHPDAQK